MSDSSELGRELCYAAIQSRYFVGLLRIRLKEVLVLLMKFLQLMFEAFDVLLFALAECSLRRTILCSSSLLLYKLRVEEMCKSITYHMHIWGRFLLGTRLGCIAPFSSSILLVQCARGEFDRDLIRCLCGVEVGGCCAVLVHLVWYRATKCHLVYMLHSISHCIVSLRARHTGEFGLEESELLSK